MDYRTEAEKIYNRTRMTEQQIRMLGEAMIRRSNPIALATVDEIESHLRMVAEVAAEVGVALYADKIAWGSSREQVVAIAQAKAKQQKRSAGARALSRKYGKNAAEQIIYRNTGKHVTLKR